MTSSADDTTSYSVVDDDVTATSSNPTCTRLYIASGGKLNIITIDAERVKKIKVNLEDFHPTCLQIYKNLLLYVPRHHRRKVICINLSTKKIIHELTFGQQVTGIKINDSGHIIFIQTSDISIYKFTLNGIQPQDSLCGLQYLHPNKVAIGNNDLIVCPTIDVFSNTSLQIYSIKSMKKLETIVASQSPLSYVAMNKDGTMVATTSEKGTIIRLFRATNGRLIQELRRGLMRYADIKSLVFSADSAFLACSSSTETIHIYKLDAEVEEPSQDGWFSYLSSSARSTANYLTAGTTEPLFIGRSFATIHISPTDDYKVHGFITSGACSLVVTDDADVLRVFSIDSVNGGECQMKTEFFAE